MQRRIRERLRVPARTTRVGACCLVTLTLAACHARDPELRTVSFTRLDADGQFDRVVDLDGERRTCAEGGTTLRVVDLPEEAGKLRFGLRVEPERPGARLEVRFAAPGVSVVATSAELEAGSSGWRDLFFEKPDGRTIAVAELVGAAVETGICFDRPSFSSRRARRRPDLLLVSIDTLRADALADAPALARLAAEGRDFRAAWAPSNWTLPSHAALMLSKPVHELALPLPGDPEPHPNLRWPAGLPTLAAALRAAGYATLASTEGGYVHPAYGFSGGFEVYGVTPSRAQGGDDPLASHLAAVDRFLASCRGDRPLFAFVHTYEVHDYFLNDAAYHGRLLEEDRPWAARGNVLAQPVGERVFDFPPAFLRRLYAAGVERTDRFLARLIGRVRRAAGEGGLLVVVVSDHGESFGQRPGVLGHHSSAIDEQTRIPLVAWSPGRLPAARVETPVGLVDVAPSLLRAAGIEPQKAFRGDARLFVADEFPGPRSVSFGFDLQSQAPAEWRLVRALVDGTRKVVREVRADGSGVRYDCFDVGPGTDLLDAPAPLAECAPLRAELDRRLATEAGSTVAVTALAPGVLAGPLLPGAGLAALDAPGALEAPRVDEDGFRWRAGGGETLLLSVAGGDLSLDQLSWDGGPVPEGALRIERRFFSVDPGQVGRRAEIVEEFEARLRALGYLR